MQLFNGKVFMAMIGAFTLNRISTSTLVDAGGSMPSNYGITENLFGFIPTTNAVMVILFQVLITRHRVKPKPSLVLGALSMPVPFWGSSLGQGSGVSGCAW